MSTIRIIRLFAIFLGLCLCIYGCATATSTTGRDFDSLKVSQIVKGKTTADEILNMFGPPSGKQPEAENAERWLYSYVTVTAHAEEGPFGSRHTKIIGGYKGV